MLSRIGRWCHNRRGIVVISWLVLLFVMGGISGAVGSAFSTAFSLPDVESARGFDILEEHFGGQGGGAGGTIVFRTDSGVADPQVQQAMSGFLAAVDDIPDLEVVSPYSPEGQQQIVAVGPEAGKIAYAQVSVPTDYSIEQAAEVTKRMDELKPQIPGLQVEYGGAIFAEFAAPESEILGLAFAIFILVVAFGSVLAMGLPIGTAIAGIGLGSIVVGLLSNVVEMPDFTSILAVMIGLGVGIDYALFIVTRYREGLHAGLSTEHAVGVAINTAGRAVLFAGTTVVISLLGMLLMNLAFVSGLGIGAAVTVLMTMLASITLLPALLGFAGERVEVTRWRGLIAASLVAIALLAVGVGMGELALFVALPLAVIVLIAGFFVGPLKREVPRRAVKPVERTPAYRWSHWIQAHPWPAVIAGTVALLVMAAPVLSLRLGFADEGNYPEETTTRKAYDLLATGFGPGFNGPILLASELPSGTSPESLQRVTDALTQSPGVAFATPARPNNPDLAGATAALWTVIPTTAPQDEATSDLVKRLRSDVLPPATAGTGLDVAVSGSVGASVDFTNYIAARLPMFIGVVLSLSFVLLMLVFRSLLVPLKAVIMNLISIAAAYGLVVAVFQWGWGKELIGIGKGGPIEPFVPMMMFAIVFGLSMDYEVFLLSRVKEEYDRGSSNAKAVTDGLTSTARVITAAAAIMVFVFGSFLLEADRIIKMFGLGLASAILLDATIVRMLLVPATMELLGEANWWLPKWLGRILPKIDVEGSGNDTLQDIEAGEVEGESPVPAGV
ncbi:MAG: Integral membrane protein [uncultured Acidimicrobiales bacterium]|uniref:Integral membrane protein n=1 Tax=uncultured Acidimicrobiales bacterium TaxID=310071 RepID=A0A6J4IGM8_9ACTN|nr:MAG: Integral membrane protein [uncultured Acidimicrobiales bacterium]